MTLLNALKLGLSAPTPEASDATRDAPDGRAEEGRGPDIKRILLLIGLGALSWVATYVGMLELIEANLGDLPLVHKVIIAFSVAMLMLMIIRLLDQMFSPVGGSRNALDRRKPGRCAAATSPSHMGRFETEWFSYPP